MSKIKHNNKATNNRIIYINTIPTGRQQAHDMQTDGRTDGQKNGTKITPSTKGHPTPLPSQKRVCLSNLVIFNFLTF